MLCFYNVTELAINSIDIVNCSAPLHTDIAKYDNKSTFYFGPGQRSAFYFSNCENISIDNMLFASVRGFSLLVVNSFGAIHINNTAIIGSNSAKICERGTSYMCAGSGMVFYYHNHVMIHSPTASIGMYNCSFIRNNNSYVPNPKHDLCYVQYLDNSNLNDHPLVTAAGISLLFTGNSSNVSVSIDEGHFLYDFPLALLVVFNNAPGLADVTLRNILVSMAHNLALNKAISCASAVRIAIDYSHYNAGRYRLLKMHNVSLMFQNLTGSVNVTAVYVTAPCKELLHSTYMYLTFQHFHCKNMKFVGIGGICLTAEVVNCKKLDLPNNKVILTFTSVNASHNSQWDNSYHNTALSKLFSHYHSPAIFSFTNMHQVIIEGSEADSTVFSHNIAAAIQAYNTRLILKGTIIFESNHGVLGGAISLYDSYLILTEGINVTFNANVANLDGAAIYVSNTPNNNLCAIQFNTSITDPSEMKNEFKLALENNTVFGRRGLNISLYPAYNCKQALSHIQAKDLKHVYSNITNSTTASVIRSIPAKVHLCKYNASIHEFIPSYVHVQRSRSIYTYPGMPINLSIAAVDLGDNIVPGDIYARVVSDNNATNKSKFALNGLDILKSFSHTDYCANFTYHILQYHGDNHIHSGSLLLFTRSAEETLNIQFKMKQCPLGYALAHGGSCKCNKFIKSLPTKFNFSCYIDRKSHKTDCSNNNSGCKATIDTGTSTWYNWIGMDAYIHSNLIYTDHCANGLCKLSKTIDLFQQDDQCTGNRRGQVCSECKPGYSVVFGTKQCMKCRNMWLLTILLYAVLGILLVLFLYITHFTIDQGTVVGIVLFANVAVFVLSQLRGHSLGFLETFTSMLNFDVGISVCFYDGMTDVVKTALQFAFPIYVWGIVILVIVISNRSTYVANLTSGNSVQVLITLVHFSFVKILRNVILIFSSLKLYRMMDNSSSPYKIDYVWYGNATIPYGGTVEHRLLLVAASVFTIGFLLPYVVMSFAAPYCLRYRLVNRFRQVYETQYGPYKDNYRYWFGVRLLLLVVFSIVYVFTEGTHIDSQLIIYTLILFFFFSVQCWIKPFKTTATNVIDLFYIGTATVGMCTAAYFTVIGEGFSTMSFNIGKLTYGLIFITFLMIIVYHVAYFVTPVNGYCRVLYNTISKCLQDIGHNHRLPLRNMSIDGQPNYGAIIQRSYNDSSYREPLLSGSN